MNILIIEDQIETQRWLGDLIKAEFPQAQCLFADSLAAASEQLDRHSWQFILVDLGLPDGHGSDFIASIRPDYPELNMIVCTVFDDDENLFTALSAGANGYLLKSQDSEHLRQQLRLMQEGHPPISPSIARRLIGFFNQRRNPSATKLTPRENQVLMLIAQGLHNREVAEHLGLTLQTVSTYIRNLYTKLNICNRAQATLEANRRGLL